MINQISEFFYSFKNKIIETDELVSKYTQEIKKYNQYIVENKLDIDCEEKFLILLGYSYRLENLSQRVFFTFQEAVQTIDLDKLMKDEKSLKENSIGYILVLNEIINEYQTNSFDNELKKKALEVYKKIEESKAKENTKYHMYQY